MLIDLHTHTTESDGTWTPEQLVEEAAARGLSVIAVTDHDTTAGVKAAQEHAPEGLAVVPGIELNAVGPDGEEVHIVGLWIDPDYTPLQDQLTVLREARIGRIEKMLKQLRELGFALDYEEVAKYAQRDVISRSHIASALLEKGYVSTKQEAFQTLIGQGCPAYVERYKLGPERAVELIRGAGGIAVLAHPGLMRNLDVIPTLVDSGLTGLEVIHSSHSPKQEEQFLSLAEELHLLPSGGSDCHGPGGKDHVFLGKYTIPVAWFNNLAARRGQQ
ncbi:MAG: PHP domain-containing protein [Firmicutes bacterium]|nr:PHP domain-containing protein [Bacillota bacterium]